MPKTESEDGKRKKIIDNYRKYFLRPVVNPRLDKFIEHCIKKELNSEIIAEILRTIVSSLGDEKKPTISSLCEAIECEAIEVIKALISLKFFDLNSANTAGCYLFDSNIIGKIESQESAVAIARILINEGVFPTNAENVLEVVAEKKWFDYFKVIVDDCSECEYKCHEQLWQSAIENELPDNYIDLLEQQIPLPNLDCVFIAISCGNKSVFSRYLEDLDFDSYPELLNNCIRYEQFDWLADILEYFALEDSLYEWLKDFIEAGMGADEFSALVENFNFSFAPNECFSGGKNIFHFFLDQHPCYLNALLEADFLRDDVSSYFNIECNGVTPLQILFGKLLGLIEQFVLKYGPDNSDEEENWDAEDIDTDIDDLDDGNIRDNFHKLSAPYISLIRYAFSLGVPLKGCTPLIKKAVHNKHLSEEFQEDIKKYQQMHEFQCELLPIAEKELSSEEDHAYLNCIKNFYPGVFAEFLDEENQDESFEENEEPGRANKVQELISRYEKKLILTYKQVKFYFYLKALSEKEFRKKPTCISTFSREQEEERYRSAQQNFLFTIIGGKVIKLVDQKKMRLTDPSSEEQVAKTIVCMLLSTACYQWGLLNKEPSSLLTLIRKLNPSPQFTTLPEAKERLATLETELDDYFGENSSSDSDDDTERSWQQIPSRDRALLQGEYQKHLSRAQPQALFIKDESKFRTKPGDVKNQYDRDARKTIHYQPDLSSSVERDLSQLNYVLDPIRGIDVKKGLETVKTKFMIAQYRGIFYGSSWSQKNRNFHRRLDEVDNPMFSTEVIRRSGFESVTDYYRQQVDGKKLDLASITLNALNLFDQLKKLQSSVPVTVKFTGKENYTYDNALCALEDFYVKKYSKFCEFLNECGLSVGQNTSEIEKYLFFLTTSKKNFLVSTADTPEHALKYAYGRKSMAGVKDTQEKPLETRYRKSGQPERPYAGKVYITLHSPEQLLEEAHHVPSMNTRGEVHVPVESIAEVETSFLSFIPADRVVAQYVTRFPSFEGEYKTVFLKKYGLTKKLYDKFKEEFVKRPLHSEERTQLREILVEHLVSFQEVCLIEEARLKAMEHGAILIYRNELGQYSKVPAKSPNENKETGVGKEQANARSDLIDSERAKRKRPEEKETTNKRFAGMHRCFRAPDDFGHRDFLLRCIYKALTNLKINANFDELQEIANKTHNENIVKENWPMFFARSYNKSMMSLDEQLQADVAFLNEIVKKYHVVIYLYELNSSTVKKIGAEDDEEGKVIRLCYSGGDSFFLLQDDPQRVFSTPGH